LRVKGHQIWVRQELLVVLADYASHVRGNVQVYHMWVLLSSDSEECG
jgi:hypothetical protein